jgi:COP9 signalosome complex subunit 7
MDQTQTKALAALQPFIYQVTTTKQTSSRFIVELIKGAISAPGTYVFTELLALPAVQALRGTDSEPWLTLLENFSWGTYEEYKGELTLSEHRNLLMDSAY